MAAALVREQQLTTKLSTETETIGEYIVLYQQQRQILASRVAAKDDYIRRCMSEIAMLTEKIKDLQDVVAALHGGGMRVVADSVAGNRPRGVRRSLASDSVGAMDRTNSESGHAGAGDVINAMPEERERAAAGFVESSAGCAARPPEEGNGSAPPVLVNSKLRQLMAPVGPREEWWYKSCSCCSGAAFHV